MSLGKHGLDIVLMERVDQQGGETHDYYFPRKNNNGFTNPTNDSGQTVSSKFGNPISAKYNLEQLLSSGLHVLTKGKRRKKILVC